MEKTERTYNPRLPDRFRRALLIRAAKTGKNPTQVHSEILERELRSELDQLQENQDEKSSENKFA